MLRLAALICLLAGTIFVNRLPAHGHDCDPHHRGCGSGNCKDHDCGTYATSHHGCGATYSIQAQPRSQEARIRKAEGKILEVVYLPAADANRAMVEIRVEQDSEHVWIRLGPASFLKQNQLTVREGETIAVWGYRVSASPEDLLVATEVRKEGKTVRFRSEIGKSLW